MIVVRNTIVDPRAMTASVSKSPLPRHFLNLLICLRDTTFAPLAVLTPQWFPHHAIDAKVVLVKPSCFHKLVDDSF
jgi:hypothetical protein